MEKLQVLGDRSTPPCRTCGPRCWNDATYREWTSVFNSESSYEGDWNQGSEIRFLGPDGDGSVAGMIATVEENRRNELISLRYVGQVVNGEDDTTSEAAKAFMGAQEKYAFSESAGATTVDVELDSEDEFVAMFDDAWPLAPEDTQGDRRSPAKLTPWRSNASCHRACSRSVSSRRLAVHRGR